HAMMAENGSNFNVYGFRYASQTPSRGCSCAFVNQLTIGVSVWTCSAPFVIMGQKTIAEMWERTDHGNGVTSAQCAANPQSEDTETDVRWGRSLSLRQGSAPEKLGLPLYRARAVAEGRRR